MAEVSIGSRFRKAWNAFMNRDPTPRRYDYGAGSYYRPDRPRFSRGNERTIVTAVINRIAMDAAAIEIKHCQLDEDDRFEKELNTNLNQCLNVSANLDQTGRAFRQDVYMSLLDEGCIAVVPVETTISPFESEGYDIYSMRVGKITQWYPQHVKVSLYNEMTGRREELIVPKVSTAIIENPFFAVMNEPNSTLQRLIRKLNLLDAVDEQANSGKLDLIIQLPYTIKSPARMAQANERHQEIEKQLSGSKYGIAYIDGTEKVIQLNRAVDNNLLSQIESLTSMLYSQLGMTQGILDGTADEQTMLNYQNRVVEPLVSANVDEMIRKFLSKTARSQKKSLLYFTDPFKLVPVNSIAEIADKFTRNEIMTSNEFRQVIGMKPSEDPAADELRNKNLSQSKVDIKSQPQIQNKESEEEPSA